IIAADGSILTNNHVIDHADRITVTLADGRRVHARVVGADPDTDIALIRIDPSGPLPVAPLGDSSRLRVGDWVCAIGNPLNYSHSVTVGVVSYLGRKLFDSSLDDYIQTDAPINLGSSGGPLIDTRGDVIGIDAAISWRARDIGFAVPINMARAILPQLEATGRVARGYIGVTLKSVDPDLQRSLNLAVDRGALVQDVTPGSPGQRAGLRPYDLIVSVDGRPVSGNDQLIRLIADHLPGSDARLQIYRDGHPEVVTVRLGQRPDAPGDGAVRDFSGRAISAPHTAGMRPDVGLTVESIDQRLARRFDLPAGLDGVMVARVDPIGPSYDADIEPGSVILQINRKPVKSIVDYSRIVRAARPGDVLTFYLYNPELNQRVLRTVRLDDP
ncbi:MAG TPA: trypsin-like peptidase domain-containing protein, partial [Vicinamibacterales bacterium]|nr:trypsin-like peptidase domain-containing protein [Vicinamibacterales bacterium]